MVSQKFYLCGDGVSTALELDISAVQTFDELQRSVAAFYCIVQADGVAFQAGELELEELAAITSSKEPVGITVGGHSVREVPGPQGLPYIGNYFEGESRQGARRSRVRELTLQHSLPRPSRQQPATVRQIWPHFQVHQHGQDSASNERSCLRTNCSFRNRVLFQGDQRRPSAEADQTRESGCFRQRHEQSCVRSIDPLTLLPLGYLLTFSDGNSFTSTYLPHLDPKPSDTTHPKCQ